MNETTGRNRTHPIAPDPLTAAILWDGYNGDNYLGSVNAVGMRFAETQSEAKGRVLDAVRWLLDRHYVRLFSVDKRRAPHGIAIPWEGTTENLVARLDSVYINESADWEKWWFACWFSNTEAGDALAEQYPPDPWDDDDD
jgi:hypothetical protein